MSSALLAGSVFAIITAPLALLGSHPLDIEVRERPLFTGQLKDVAGLYLGVAAVASLGVSTLARRSSRQTSSATSPDLGASAFAQPAGQSSFLGEGAIASTPAYLSTDEVQTPAAQTPLAGAQVFDLTAHPVNHSTDSPNSADSSRAASVVGATASALPQPESAELLSPLSLRAKGLDFFLDDSLTEIQLGAPEPAVSESTVDFTANATVPAAMQSAAPSTAQSTAPEFLPTIRPLPQVPDPSLTPRSVHSIRLSRQSEPEGHSDARQTHSLGPAAHAGSPTSLPLETWAEAFLSDAPVVPLPPQEEANSNETVALSEASSYLHPQVRPAVEVLSSAASLEIAAAVPSRRLTGPVMPAAQTYLSFTHFASTASLYAPERSRNLQLEMEALEKLEQVREQIQVLTNQMEMIQSSLSLQDYSAQQLVALPSATPKATYTVSTGEISSNPQQPVVVSPQRYGRATRPAVA